MLSSVHIKKSAFKELKEASPRKAALPHPCMSDHRWKLLLQRPPGYRLYPGARIYLQSAIQRAQPEHE